MPTAPLAANTNLEGRSVVELDLRLPNNKIIPFSSLNIVHISSNITESIKTSSIHEVIVRAPTTDYVDQVIRFAQSQGTPRIRYRIGTGPPGHTAYLPWQDMILDNFGAALEGMGKSAGHYVRLKLSDDLYRLSRGTKVAVRKGKISDIVRAIALENGMSNVVIEDTPGSTGTWIQSYVDDVDFIRKRLVRRAINDKGRGNYNFYVQDNVLHFHSPDYQAALKELVYYQSNNVGLTQIDESQDLVEAGASGVRVITYNPYTGAIRELADDPSKALRFGNVMTQLSNVKGADLDYLFHVSDNTVQEPTNMAQTIYENARSQALGLKIDVARSVFLRVGDILRVTISPSSGKNSVWSGVYHVVTACYHIESGTLFSSFVVKRGEYQTSNMAPTSIQVLGDSVVVSDQEAPGQDLNLKLSQSSPLTHGAGKEGFTSIFVNTQDPNSAPNPKPRF